MGDTVWLASYPRSGNTWFRAVYTAWRQGPDRRLDLRRLGGGAIPASRREFDQSLGVRSSVLTADEIDQLRPRADEVVDARAGRIQVRKVHDAYFCGPAGEPVMSVAATRAAINLVRDPRDVAVSYARHRSTSMENTVGHMGDPDATMGEQPRGITNQLRQRLGTWSEHVVSWMDRPPFPVMTIRYEDCLHDPVAVFGAALRFAGFEVGDDEVVAAVERSSFEILQRQESEAGFGERPPGMDRFFRRGEVGAWRDELDPALAMRIEADHETVMRRLGYQLSC